MEVKLTREQELSLINLGIDILLSKIENIKQAKPHKRLGPKWTKEQRLRFHKTWLAKRKKMNKSKKLNKI